MKNIINKYCMTGTGTVSVKINGTPATVAHHTKSNQEQVLSLSASATAPE
jgi:hypothetical protein